MTEPIPARAGKTIHKIEWVRSPDDEMQPPRSTEPDRAENFRETWEYQGVCAKATIVVAGVLQTIASAGLWGIESDSNDSYFREVAAEEFDELKVILEALGFTTVEIDACEYGEAQEDPRSYRRRQKDFTTKAA